MVELLVVVGIITLLAAILFPVFGKAREHANRAKCLSTLRGMGQAAQAHAAERRGHMPLAGQVPAEPWPYQVGDALMVKYQYYTWLGSYQPPHGPSVVPQPLAAALAHYMNIQVGLGIDAEVFEAVNSERVYRFFTCASDAEPKSGSTIDAYAMAWAAPPAVMSYGFNAAVLGQMPNAGRPGLGGNVARCRRPSEVFLFVDARPGIGPRGGFRVPAGETLYDYWRIQSAPPVPGQLFRFATFDHSRHRNRTNVLFVDGHGETLTLDPARSGVTPDEAGKGDLERVGVWKGIAE